MRSSRHSPSHPGSLSSALWRVGLCCLMVATLNGCAALAVSLAGAGAGAALSHNMSGMASRTFADTMDKVDTASRIAVRKLQLDVESVASTEKGQVTRARLSNLSVEVELETLSTTMTRVSVVARKDLIRVDAATAQEIVVQIERALVGIQQAELAEAEADRARAERATYFTTPQPPASRKNGSKPATPNPQARKTSI